MLIKGLSARTYLGFVGVLGVFLCLTSWATPPKKLVVRLSEDLGSLDYLHEEVSPHILYQLHEGLTKVGTKGQAEPGLALAWKWDAHKKSITFRLRKDARWSDGSALCAADFKRSIDRIHTQHEPSLFLHFYRNIIRTEAPNCHQLTITLREADIYFPVLLAHWVFFPTPKGTDKIYSGPYIVEKYQPNTSISLRRNLNHYKKSRYEEVEFLFIADDATAMRLFDDRKIDILRDPPVLERTRRKEQPEYRRFKTLVNFHLQFAHRTGFDRQERCAIKNAIQQKIHNLPKIFNDEVTAAKGFLHPAFGALKGHYANSGNRTNSQKALNKEITISYYAKNTHDILMEWLQAVLKEQLKLNVNLDRIEPKQYWSKLATQPPAIFLSGTTAQFNSPKPFFMEFVSNNTANWGHYRSDSYDRAVEQNDFDLANQILLEQDCAAVPLYFRDSILFVQTTIKDIFVNPLNFFYL